MTVGIGIATREGVILAADSAVTHGSTLVGGRSSFGEANDLDQGIEEGALKIVPLGTHAAASIAGVAADAVEALAWFRPHVQAPDFIKAWESAMSVVERVDFSALIGRWREGRAELFRCSGRSAEQIRIGRAAIIGSAKEDERITLQTRTRILLVRGNRPEMIQLGLCALLIWRALNEVGFKDNIGGAPASLLVNSTGTAWLPDTSVYAVDVRPDSTGELQIQDPIHRVSIIGRDTAVAVSSTFTDATRVLMNPMTEDRRPEWIETWGEEVLNIANENRVKLVALVALIQRRLAVLRLDLCQGKYILVQPDMVTFGEELKKFFRGPAPTQPGGAVYSIPLGEPRALAMVEEGGPVDEYDVDLGVYYMINVCVVDKNFDDAYRVWESMIARYPYHPEVLTAGLVALELEPDAPRLARVLDGWDVALTAKPELIEQARFVATQHPEHPEVASRLEAAIRRTKS